MTGLHIEHREAIPHDGSRRIIAVGRIGPARDTGSADDELLGQVAEAERAADGVKAVARTGHRVIDQQQREGQ